MSEDAPLAPTTYIVAYDFAEAEAGAGVIVVCCNAAPHHVSVIEVDGNGRFTPRVPCTHEDHRPPGGA